MPGGLWFEGKFYIAAFKDHVNLGFGISGLTKKEADRFEGKGKTMRHLKFYSVDDVKEKSLVPLMKMVHKKTICGCEIKWKTTITHP